MRILMVAFLVFSASGFAKDSMSAHIQPLQVDIGNKAALQRGAKLYMNYCSGCHSLKYLRYNQLAKGLGLLVKEKSSHKELLHNNLIFTESEINDPVAIAMPATDARQWFGVIPPDLSLTARVRGPSWLYTYLKGFYEDESKAFGTNNLVFPDVAMPNVLYNLQGRQIAVFKTTKVSQAEGERTQSTLQYLQKTDDGEMSTAQFDRAVKDLVTFLSFVGEPIQKERGQLGVWVIGFLLILLLFSYFLKKEYWREEKRKH